MPEPLLALTEVSKGFVIHSGWFGRARAHLKAVREVSLTVAAGETLGLVGESGCGKSTLARLCALLYRPDGGSLRLTGVDPAACDRRRLKALRRRTQMVFQDPFASLNPRLPLAAILTEPLTLHRVGSRRQRRQRAAAMLDAVGLAADCLDRYPHEFSGGQRQRVAIARALMLEPDLIVADEAVSALDVSVQSQILNLLLDLKERLGLAYLFISHDLAVVGHIADRVAVMYLGRIVETADRDALFAAPAHPYTATLLATIPAIQRGGKRRSGVAMGEVPSAVRPPPGCPYHPRCPQAQDLCRRERPPLAAPPDRGAGHQVACHFPLPGSASRPQPAAVGAAQTLTGAPPL